MRMLLNEVGCMKGRAFAAACSFQVDCLGGRQGWPIEGYGLWVQPRSRYGIWPSVYFKLRFGRDCFGSWVGMGVLDLGSSVSHVAQDGLPGNGILRSRPKVEDLRASGRTGHPTTALFRLSLKKILEEAPNDWFVLTRKLPRGSRHPPKSELDNHLYSGCWDFIMTCLNALG